jgi:hypothetical protein
MTLLWMPRQFREIFNRQIVRTIGFRRPFTRSDAYKPLSWCRCRATKLNRPGWIVNCQLTIPAFSMKLAVWPSALGRKYERTDRAAIANHTGALFSHYPVADGSAFRSSTRSLAAFRFSPRASRLNSLGPAKGGRKRRSANSARMMRTTGISLRTYMTER